MSVYLNPGDSFESAIRKFNRQVQHTGLLAEARSRLRYESPRDKLRRKAAKAAQRKKRAVGNKKPTLFYN